MQKYPNRKNNFFIKILKHLIYSHIISLIIHCYTLVSLKDWYFIWFVNIVKIDCLLKFMWLVKERWQCPIYNPRYPKEICPGSSMNEIPMFLLLLTDYFHLRVFLRKWLAHFLLIRNDVQRVKHFMREENYNMKWRITWNYSYSLDQLWCTYK